MSRKKTKNHSQTEKDIARIRRLIVAVDLVCQGNVQKRMKTCGKAGCPCLKDPPALHGPYYEWTRREKGRFKNSLVSAEQAKKFAQAIKNHRKILRFLTTWGAKSASIIRTRFQ